MAYRISKKESIATLLLLLTYINNYSFYVFLGGMKTIISFAPYIIHLIIIVWGISGKQDVWMKRKILYVGLTMIGVATCYTLLLWLIDPVEFRAVTRLWSTAISISLNVYAAAILVIKLKDKAAKVFMRATLLAYTWSLLSGTIYCGIGELFSYIAHVTTYSGPILRFLEMHQPAFVLGIMLLYYIFFLPQKRRRDYLEIIIGLVYFILAFKRIGIGAFIVASIAMIVINNKVFELSRKAVLSFGIIVITVSTLYVSNVYNGAFETYMLEHGINMMGRDVLYIYFAGNSFFGIDYFGKGFSYVSKMLESMKVDDVGNMVNVRGLHNDLYRIYIELGFIGSILWNLFYSYLVPRKIMEDLGTKVALCYVIITAYAYITYMTDNTLFYEAVRTALLLVPFSYYYALKKSTKEH